MTAAAASRWEARRRAVFQSVFQTDISQPTPHSTPSLRFPDQGQVFGDPISRQQLPFSRGGTKGDGDDLATSIDAPLVSASPFLSPSSQPLFRGHAAADDQVKYDRAWHVVTSRLVLPSSVTAEDSFGTLAPESQFHSQDDEVEFNAALRLILNAPTLLPQATHTEDILSWHTQQVRRHFVQHVLPLLSALSGPAMVTGQGYGSDDGYDSHMVVVQSSVQTLEAALRQYFYCLSLIVRGLQRESNDIYAGSPPILGAGEPPVTPGVIVTRFRRDIHALVSNSASPSLMASLRAVLLRLVSTTLEMPAPRANPNQSDGNRDVGVPEPARPRSDSIRADAARKRLLQLVDALSKVGLAGERFQILFAEIMDSMMTEYVHRSYARLWRTPGKPQAPDGLDKRAARSISLGSAPWCIVLLCDWIENQYARLALEVLSGIEGAGIKHQPGGVSLSDVKKWKEIGVGRLAALRISELYDIVLQWPQSRGGLDDLRASVTTPQRRLQLTDAFSAALERRLLHPACSTLQILQVYIAMIRTFHALDNSKVLLSRVVSSLQIYLCQRDDAVRIVVNGLLASPEEAKQAQLDEAKAEDDASATDTTKVDKTEGTGKLVELAVILNDPSQQRRQPVDDEDLDWDDMEWLPDPVDAGVNYRRPKSEDVIGTLISALGSQDVFIKEFQSTVAERLLSGQPSFDQEIKVLNLLKKRFGEGALQNCDVMIKDIYDSRRVDAVIRRVQGMQPSLQPQLQSRVFGAPTTPSGPSGRSMSSQVETARDQSSDQMPYHARILSRLYWPNIVYDAFLLPNPVAEQQALYNKGYERLKSSRKLAWLDQLGQASVELELKDRTLAVECKTYEAAAIYAFQDPDAADDADVEPVRRTGLQLQEMLGMDEELVFQALEFWESRGVLRQVEADTYAVVETQDTAQHSATHRPGLLTSASAPAALEGDARKPAKERSGTTGAMGAKERERRQLYWQYVVGLLTNSMPVAPLGQIAMMLKMLIAEGFAWSNEELQEFLSEKVADGELELVGGKYKLIKR
ncbi:Anaphase-promoting complex subunit 2 [Pleurostoma richardsiae]|uniref:Anaphase-promoting complex subunit 2 n=1 Tax=Pleurostoma richardsiae TaxID=41990 RepID=A0AA38RPM7_9PEZI|nr:Anaphase-promoting complex subunit 2 [Pleurostoma richardsiae]